MTELSTRSGSYAKGWLVNNTHDQWQLGSLPGTASLWRSTSEGYTWAILLNTNPDTKKFWAKLGNLGRFCIAATSKWPTHDLMAAPTVAASNVAVSEGSGRLVVKWSNGGGERRIVTVSAESAAEAFPRNGTDYGAASLFGAGNDLGGENYVVFNGTDDRVIVTGLTPCKRYRVRVFEYNQNANTGNHALYLLGHHPETFAVPKPLESL